MSTPAKDCPSAAIELGSGGDVVVDGAVAVDGGVDLSATFVVHVDESTVMILVNATIAASGGWFWR